MRKVTSDSPQLFPRMSSRLKRYEATIKGTGTWKCFILQHFLQKELHSCRTELSLQIQYSNICSSLKTNPFRLGWTSLLLLLRSRLKRRVLQSKHRIKPQRNNTGWKLFLRFKEQIISPWIKKKRCLMFILRAKTRHNKPEMTHRFCIRRSSALFNLFLNTFSSGMMTLHVIQRVCDESERLSQRLFNVDYTRAHYGDLYRTDSPTVQADEALKAAQITAGSWWWRQHLHTLLIALQLCPQSENFWYENNTNNPAQTEILVRKSYIIPMMQLLNCVTPPSCDQCGCVQELNVASF